MKIQIYIVIVYILVGTVIAGGVQVFLAGRKSKGWGLILPGLSLLFAVYMTGVSLFVYKGGAYESFPVIGLILLSLIPLVVHIIIYRIMRKRVQKQNAVNDINKTLIEDL